MPATDVRVPSWSLQRLKPWYPSQYGVPGTDLTTGLRRYPDSKVLYVDPNATGVTDQRDGTDPDAPLATVAAAITKCRSWHGDIIIVRHMDAWQYAPQTETPIQESVTVDKHGIAILGVSPGSPLGPVWQPGGAGETAITVAALDVRIAGFCFGAPLGGNAIYSEWDGATLWGENLVIEDCFFDDEVDIAIQLEYSWNCWIRRCVFQECDAYGIYIDPAGSGIDYLHVSDCEFRDVGTSAISGRVLDSSEILRCRVWNSNAYGAAAATDEGFDLAGGDENIIADCWFSCLLPVPANGDWDDLNSDGAPATSAWIGNYCMDGLAVTNPT